MSVCVTRSRSSVQTRLGSIDLDWLKWGLRWATTDTQAVPTVRRLQESETCQCLDFGQNGAIIGSKLRHDTHFLSTLVLRKHFMASPSILPRSSILLFFHFFKNHCKPVCFHSDHHEKNSTQISSF